MGELLVGQYITDATHGRHHNLARQRLLGDLEPSELDNETRKGVSEFCFCFASFTPTRV